MTKGASFHQFIYCIGAICIVIEIFKVHFEEMNLFFYFFKDYLVMPIIIGLFKDSCKKKLIQTPNLINVHENNLRFLSADDLFVE
jgi:hypothetical protein